MKNKFRLYSFAIIGFGMLGFFFTEALAMDIMNVLMPILEKTYGWSRLSINSAMSMGSIGAIIAGFAFGTLIMKFGLHKVAGVAFFPVGILTMIVGSTSDLKIFILAMTLLQTLVGVGLLAVTTFVTNWFFEKRGWVLGLVALAMPVGSATFVPACTNLIMAYGKTNVFIVLGLMVMLLGVFCFTVLKDKPEDVGLSPDGIERTPQEVAKIKSLMEYKSEWTLGKLLSTKETWLIILGNGLMFFMMTGIMSQFIPRLLDVGFPIQKALGIMSVSAIIGIPMSCFWGWISDKVTTPKICAIFSLTYIFGAYFIANISSNDNVFVILTVAFIASATGGMMTLMTNSVAYVYGRRDFVNVGRYIMMTREIFRSAAFILMGIFHAKFGSYTNAYYLFMLLALLSTATFLSIRKTYDEEREPLLGSTSMTGIQVGVVNKPI
jgi:sugar phosphate permease